MSEYSDGLHKASARLLRRRAAAATPQGDAVLWPARRFGLEHIAAYVAAPEEMQRSVLDRCGLGLLRESSLVERGGMEFCARMVLLSEDVQQRTLYSLIGADEASHYAWLQPWLGQSGDTLDPFNSFLADCVRIATPQPLAYLMQVVLEGFGIVHYAGLAADCSDAALAATLQRMAEDEALHHAAGLAVFERQRLSASECEFLLDASYTFVQMIRSGPQAVVAALDTALGGIDAAALPPVFERLDAAAETASKLARLRQLMAQPGMHWLVDALAARNAFTPAAAGEAAQVYVALR